MIDLIPIRQIVKIFVISMSNFFSNFTTKRKMRYKAKQVISKKNTNFMKII